MPHWYAISADGDVIRFKTREARDTFVAVPLYGSKWKAAKYRFPSPVQSAVRRGDVVDAEGDEG